MSKNLVVDVVSRSETGKNVSRRLRRSGSIPAVIYGMGKPALALVVEPETIQSILTSESRGNTLFQLRLDGAKDRTRHVMIRDRQKDPVTGDLVHVDFVRIDLERKVLVEVPVQIEGIAAGVKNDGGILDFIGRTIQVSCFPQDIPGSVLADVTEMNVGQVLRVKDLPGDPRHEVLTDPEHPILVISAPPAAEPTPEEEAAAEAEGVEGVEGVEGIEGAEVPAAEGEGEAPASPSEDKKS